MRAFACFSFFFGLTYLHAFAQTTPATVIFCTGKVEYTPEYNRTATPVYPGFIMDIAGSLQCHSGASVKFLYKGVSITFDRQLSTPVAELVKGVEEASDAGFFTRFWSFLQNCMNDSPAKLEENHRNHMEHAGGSIKGFASGEYAVKALGIASGKLPSARVTFAWRRTPGKSPWVFQLNSADGDNIVHALVRDTLITLDLDELHLDLQTDYQWAVARENEHSAALPFRVVPAVEATILEKLHHEKAWIDASPAEKNMMLAFALEQGKHFYSANQLYTEMRREDPKNFLLRMIHASFLTRMDMLDEAKMLISEKTIEENK